MSPLDRLLMFGARQVMAWSLRLDQPVPGPPQAPAQPVGLYLHVPFCASLCPFCPFHRQHYERELAARYFDALEREVRHFESLGYRFESVYVGGGTPTVASVRLGRLLEQLRERHPIRTIAVETNPDHLDDAHLAPLIDAGVQRLSVGVQSLDDGVLQKIGRLHAYGDAESILARLAPVFERFETVNVDMMFNLPEQSLASLDTDLALLRDLRPPQISWYPLMPPLSGQSPHAADGTSHRSTLHPGAFDRVTFADEKRLFQHICERLDDTYDLASVWCFDRRRSDSPVSRAIDEYIIEPLDYLGLGSGAFSLLGGLHLTESFNVRDYLQRVGESGHGMTAQQSFSPAEKARYLFLTRLFSGHWSSAALADELGPHWRRRLWPLLPLMRWLGAFERGADGLKLTPRGRYQWLVLMREFFMQVNEQRVRRRRIDDRSVNPLALVPAAE